MKSHRVAVILALVGACALMSGCGGPPQPVASTPLFSSEDEAFAAAEETYRNYVDALNLRRDDPTSSPDPQSFLTGRALEVDIDTQRQMQQAQLSIVGTTRIVDAVGIRATPEAAVPLVQLTICLDSSDARVLDASGADRTPAEKDDLYALIVSFVGEAPAMLISDSETASGQKC